MSLSQFLHDNKLTSALLPEMQTRGFLTALAAAPYPIDPKEWISLLWGGAEQAPFTSHAQFEQYAQIIVEIWNQEGEDLLTHCWKWPDECTLSDDSIVNEQTREYCEGMLQGYAWTKDDWHSLIKPDSTESELLDGVLLSISLLFDPDAALLAIEEQNGAIELEQFKEIYDNMPIMLSGLTQRIHQLVDDLDHDKDEE